MEESISSSNINARWLDNIYENIKRIEELERVTREGCGSIIDYLNLAPRDRAVALVDAQYKTLSLLITEFHLLIADLSPIINEETKNNAIKVLGNADKIIGMRSLFIEDEYNSNNTIVNSKLTDFFWETVKFLYQIKIEVFKEIKNILYIGSSN